MEMERLTKNDLNKVCYDPWEICGMDKHCTKGCYDEGGCTKGCHILKIHRKLAEYEDAEEQGLLLRLPCKVGDTVYLVDFEEKAYDEATVWSIEIDTKDNRILINSDYEVGTWAEDGYLFYSREDAEQALKQMKGE